MIVLSRVVLGFLVIATAVQSILFIVDCRRGWTDLSGRWSWIMRAILGDALVRLTILIGLDFLVLGLACPSIP